MPSDAPRTTKFSRAVTTIADVQALERSPYDELVPARNLYQLFEATARLHPERPALTVMPSGDPEESAVTLSHKGLLEEITRAANLFRSLGISPSGGAVAFLCPALPKIPPALIGAQVAGVASTINFLLNADAIADLLIARTGDGTGHSLRCRRCGALAEGQRGYRPCPVASTDTGRRR
jgi:fatty-acyl-CoA synthase